MKKSKPFILLALLISATSVAASDDVIQWQVGQAAHDKAVTINFDKLANGVEYNLECHISIIDIARKGKANIQIVTNGKIQVLVNAIDTSNNNGLVTLMYPTNSLKSPSVNNNSVIMVRNIDHYNSIDIYKCTAMRVFM